MKLEEIQRKYFNIPNELKKADRWICYSIVKDEETGETKKIPMCAFNGGYAKSNDSNTWTNFNVACMGCEKFNFNGLGFVLGDGFFGIDIDNHKDKNGDYQLTPEQFECLSQEFISSIDSYAEYSYSGKGIHIICKGILPNGQRRKLGCPIEMYDDKRFFTMSGNVIKKSDVKNCTESVRPLYDKYLFTEKKEKEIDRTIINEDGSIHFGDTDIIDINVSQDTLNDHDLINKIISSKNGQDFLSLYNGDMSSAKNDHSAADLALLQILAFWTIIIKRKWIEFLGQVL